MHGFLNQLGRALNGPAGAEPGIAYERRPLVLPTPITLTQGQWTVIRSGARFVTSLLVQVQSGVLDLYFGETPSNQPPMRFQEGLGPQQVYLGARDYVFCASAPIDVSAVVTLLGPADG